MKFSVIIPTYNRKAYLPRALDSVLNQTCQDFEILVIDDGSTDGTEDLFKTAYTDSRIVYHRFAGNRGVHEARNKGLDLARGDYVALLDSDDEWFSDALERVEQVFTAHPEVGIFGAPYIFPDGKLTGRDQAEDGIVPFADILCRRNLRQQKGGFVAFRRSLVRNIRWPASHLMFTLFRRLGRNTESYFISKPLGRYHFLNDSLSTSVRRKIPDATASIKRGLALADFVDEFTEEFNRHCPSCIAVYAYGAALGCLLAHQTKRGRKYAKMASGHSRGSWRYRLLYWFTFCPFAGWLLRLAYWIKKIIS